MVKVLFFAHIRELLGVDHLVVDIASLGDRPSPRALIDHLGGHYGAQFTATLNRDNVIIAINHATADRDNLLNDGDEVAFYPPVTGG